MVQQLMIQYQLAHLRLQCRLQSRMKNSSQFPLVHSSHQETRSQSDLLGLNQILKEMELLTVSSMDIRILGTRTWGSYWDENRRIQTEDAVQHRPD
jgi:hypothetical protein